MEFRQLEYFQMVSRLSSITKAAEHLHVAQPSITISIRKLEEELGVSLFDRSQKQIALTYEGEIFLRHANDILTHAHDAITEMNDYRLLQKGSIKIGVPPTIGAFLFPPIFANFQKSYPHLELTVSEAGSITIRDHLERGELDIGIIIISNVSSHLIAKPITAGQILVCLPRKHPLSALPRIPFDRLRNEPFVLLKEDTYNRLAILKECEEHHFSPKIVFSSSQIETILGLVEQGVGVSFLLDGVPQKHNDVVTRPLEQPLTIQIGLAWKKDRYLSHAAKAFIQFISYLFPAAEEPEGERGQK